VRGKNGAGEEDATKRNVEQSEANAPGSWDCRQGRGARKGGWSIKNGR